MIHKDDNLDFLKKRIQEIRLANFSPEINSLLQLPNNVINTLKTDDEGNIWFFTSCSSAYISDIDKNFYASLDYFNKTSDCRLHIDGKARIVGEEEDSLDALPYTLIRKNKSSFASNVVLIKFKILKAEYHEAKHVSTSLKETIRNIFVDIFYSNTHKQFNFFEAVPTDFNS